MGARSCLLAAVTALTVAAASLNPASPGSSVDSTALPATQAASVGLSAIGGSVRRIDVRVMSFNIHNGADDEDDLDLAATADVIRSSGAEVIGLQEVDKHKSRRSDFVDQTAWLAHRLGMYSAFGANIDRKPRRGHKERSQYGTAILSKYPILSARNHLLENIPYKKDPSEQRGLLETVIDLDGVSVGFYTTHLDHKRREQRSGQIQQVLKIISGSKRPTILVGDFNAVPDAPEMRQVTRQFTDVFALLGLSQVRSFPAEEPARRIDYILTRGRIEERRAGVVDTDASDHLPVTADLTIVSVPPGNAGPVPGSVRSPAPVWF